MVSLKDYRCGASAAVSDMQRAREFYQGVLGLVPGTDYRVEVWDACSEGDIYDEVWTTAAAAAAAPAAVPQGPDRYIFCAIAGNTDVNGNPIAPGTSLNLEPDQVANDDHYKGATIGVFVAGVGATCQLTPLRKP